MRVLDFLATGVIVWALALSGCGGGGGGSSPDGGGGGAGSSASGAGSGPSAGGPPSGSGPAGNGGSAGGVPTAGGGSTSGAPAVATVDLHPDQASDLPPAAAAASPRGVEVRATVHPDTQDTVTASIDLTPSEAALVQNDATVLVYVRRAVERDEEVDEFWQDLEVKSSAGRVQVDVPAEAFEAQAVGDESVATLAVSVVPATRQLAVQLNSLVPTSKVLIHPPLDGQLLIAGPFNEPAGHNGPHSGIDFVTPVGSAVYSPGPGSVTKLYVGRTNSVKLVLDQPPYAPVTIGSLTPAQAVALRTRCGTALVTDVDSTPVVNSARCSLSQGDIQSIGLPARKLPGPGAWSVTTYVDYGRVVILDFVPAAGAETYSFMHLHMNATMDALRALCPGITLNASLAGIGIPNGRAGDASSGTVLFSDPSGARCKAASAGAVIARSGRSGTAGAHLHMAYKPGQAVSNPLLTLGRLAVDNNSLALSTPQPSATIRVTVMDQTNNQEIVVRRNKPAVYLSLNATFQSPDPGSQKVTSVLGITGDSTIVKWSLPAPVTNTDGVLEDRGMVRFDKVAAAGTTAVHIALLVDARLLAKGKQESDAAFAARVMTTPADSIDVNVVVGPCGTAKGDPLCQ